MIRIWAKVIKDGKILKQCVYEKTENMDYSKFYDYARDICETLDIPTPVIIKTHLFNYAKYNTLKFKPEDFMENVLFDRLVFENAFI